MSDHPRKFESIHGHSPEVHPSAWVHASATVIGNVVLGERASVWPGARLRGDEDIIKVGAFTNIQDNAVLHMTGGRSCTIVGERVTVGHSAILHGCTVGDDCLIGMGAIVIDNAVIGSGSMVGAGSLVTGGKEFPPGMMILGSPAKAVRPLSDKEREWIQHSWTHYSENAAAYAARDAAAAAAAAEGDR